MITIERLKNWGADVETGLSRCVNNETLYLRLVKICLDEVLSGTLGEALESGESDKAFEIAHKLKGGSGNLALTPINAPLCVLTDLLRNKTLGDCGKLYEEIMKEANKLKD